MDERIPLTKESAPNVQLRVVMPDGDKGFMIGFDGNTEEECMAYNIACRNVMTRHDLLPFHQKGVDPIGGNNHPGYHAWEVYRRVTKEQLDPLLAEIEVEAKIYLTHED